MEIDVERLSGIEAELEELSEHEVITVLKDGEPAYVIMPVAAIESGSTVVGVPQVVPMGVNVISSKPLDLSYDEYEVVKKQIIEAFDKTFKPKPEKLN